MAAELLETTATLFRNGQLHGALLRHPLEEVVIDLDSPPPFRSKGVCGLVACCLQSGHLNGMLAPLGPSVARTHFRPLLKWSEELMTGGGLPIREQRLRSNEKQFLGGLVFKAHRLLYHSTLGRE